MDFKPNAKGMRDLEKKLTANLEVSKSGSEAAAAAKAKRDYEKKTGAKLSDSAAREIVRKARGK